MTHGIRDTENLTFHRDDYTVFKNTSHANNITVNILLHSYSFSLITWYSQDWQPNVIYSAVIFEMLHLRANLLIYFTTGLFQRKQSQRFQSLIQCIIRETQTNATTVHRDILLLRRSCS